MRKGSFSSKQGALRVRREKSLCVEITRGVREELLILIGGQLASLTRPETVSALKAAGAPVVRDLSRALESGTAEARAEAAWLLGQMGAEAAIPALARSIEDARWRGEAPVVLRRATEALLRLGPAGIHAFDRAIRRLAPDDLTRLLLIRRATEQLAGILPPPPLYPHIVAAWARALAQYLERLERLDRVGRAGRLSFQRVVLEAYGLSLERDRQAVPRLIEFLNGYPARAGRQANHAS